MEDLGLEANQGHTSYWKEKFESLTCTFMLCTNVCNRQDVREAFFDDLQNALNQIPPEESYVMLGDFNTRVGLGAETGICGAI